MEHLETFAGIAGVIAVLVLAFWLINLFIVGALWGAIKGAGVVGLLVMGYTAGGYVRMGALALLTLAIFPLGLLVAFLIGLGDWKAHVAYCEANRLPGHPIDHL